MNDILKRLKGPGIGLIITGSLNGVIGLLTLLSGLARLAGLGGKERIIRDDAEKLGYFVGTGLGYGIGLLSMLLAPLIILGGIKLMKGKSRGLAMTAAVLAILPATSCCFVIGAVFGIWALVVLMNPEVKAYFAGGPNQQFNPPPQNWQ